MTARCALPFRFDTAREMKSSGHPAQDIRIEPTAVQA
jgi:hypothetical protein